MQMNNEVCNTIMSAPIANTRIFHDALSASEIASELTQLGGGSEQEGIRELGRICYRQGAEDMGNYIMNQLCNSYSKPSIENQYLNRQLSMSMAENKELHVGLGIVAGIIAVGAVVGGVVLHNKNKNIKKMDKLGEKYEEAVGAGERNKIHFKPWNIQTNI